MLGSVLITGPTTYMDMAARTEQVRPIGGHITGVRSQKGFNRYSCSAPRYFDRFCRDDARTKSHFLEHARRFESFLRIQ